MRHNEPELRYTPARQRCSTVSHTFGDNGPAYWDSASARLKLIVANCVTSSRGVGLVTAREEEKRRGSRTGVVFTSAERLWGRPRSRLIALPLTRRPIFISPSALET